MRLLNPSPGEVVDRITILTLKMHYAELKGKDVRELKAEHGALYVYLGKEFPSSNLGTNVNDFSKLMSQLQETNHDLWKLEDEIRLVMSRRTLGLLDKDKDQGLHASFGIAETNDRRMVLVGKINQLFDKPVEEKIYK